MQMGSRKSEQTKKTISSNRIESNRIEIIFESNRIVFFSAESPSTNFFIRATKEANSVCSMYEHDHESFHHNFQQVLLSLTLIVLLSEVGPATATNRSVHELSLSGETTPCDWSNLALLA